MFEEVISNSLNRWLAILQPHERIFFPYLLGSLLIAIVIWYHAQKKTYLHDTQPSQDSLFKFLFNPKTYIHKSTWQDMAIFVFNGFFFSGILASLIISVPFYVQLTVNSLSSITGTVPTANQPSTVITTLAHTLVFILCLDFNAFFSHYLQHKIPTLWAFHKVHHSAEVLNPLTAYRMHPVDLILSSILFSLILGLTYGVSRFYTGTEPTMFEILGINIFLFSYFLLGYNLRHSSIWLNYPNWLSYLLISPAQHQIHHSQNPVHFDKNMGLIFSFWDRAFGTLYTPKQYEHIDYGIDQQKPNPYKSVSEIYFTPFKEAWCILNNKISAFHLSAFILLAIGVYLLLFIESSIYSKKQLTTLPSLHTEELTSHEIQHAIDLGFSSLIIPTGGIEQNGPHMVTGKHQYIVRHNATKIAKALGNTLISPVINFVPEEPHAAYPGTIHVDEKIFIEIVNSTINSFSKHGVKNFYLIGDSAGNQPGLKKVANNSMFDNSDINVQHIDQYYVPILQNEALANMGYTPEDIGTHAGIRDTSELLAITPEHIRKAPLVLQTAKLGHDGKYNESSEIIGEQMLDIKIKSALQQIQQTNSK